ncbi:MAG: hypothetical protein RBR22_13200 [Desulfuromonas sp.]|nr:hypothetical protein [Desulfuromonas sp.]
MKCPNCDFIDKDEAFGDPAKCPECGAFYDKALKVKELKNALARQSTAADTDELAAVGKSEDKIARERARKEQRDHEARVKADLKAKAESDRAELKRQFAQERQERERIERGRKVVIADIDMPFWSMVQFMVKWALASIPAVLILMLIFYGFVSIFKIIVLN